MAADGDLDSRPNAWIDRQLSSLRANDLEGVDTQGLADFLAAAKSLAKHDRRIDAMIRMAGMPDFFTRAEWDLLADWDGPIG